MKTGLSLKQLAAELERQSEAKQDFVVDTRELAMLSGTQPGTGHRVSELVLPKTEDFPGGEFEVSNFCHRQIGSRLGIPATFYDRLLLGDGKKKEPVPALLDHTVNTLLREQPERRMVRTFDWEKTGPDPDHRDGGKVARAFLSDRYRRLDNDELAKAALPILGEIEDVKILSCDITERKMYIKAVAPRVQGDVKRGDTVQAGVVISNSEVGSGALKIEPLVYRLICLNGMIVAAATRQYHIGRQLDSDEALAVLSDETIMKDDAAFFSKIQDVVKAAVDETRFNAIVAAMRESTETVRIQKPIESMERMQKRFSFSDAETENVLKHLVEGGDLSAYGALNAVTRASQDVEDYDRATELEMVGGEILALSGGKQWKELAAA